jgi:hypothetical protein
MNVRKYKIEPCANLRGANLRGANLDHSRWPLWYGSKAVKLDTQQADKMRSHLARMRPVPAKHPANPVPRVSWIKRISNYRLLRRLGFTRKVARSWCQYNCDYLRKKSQHRPWFVPGCLARR